ncbi:hypothetical protein [Streptomyces sp. NPDC005859]|uniref:hypothetical protein n=1 Tax=Streptomyces sp. NPDC005859 TaxID=3157170 RepID=UPI0033E7FECC
MRQLIARPKGGTIPQAEAVKEIARTISEGWAGRDLYRLLYAAARAGGPAYESWLRSLARGKFCATRSTPSCFARC